jgi:decaprenylphospho-beta-D-ribofuranose 2-oxidase
VSVSGQPDYRWPATAYEERGVHSFDGGVADKCVISRPDRYAVFQQKVPGCGPIIARGSGLSYAAASFGGGGVTIDMRLFDRVLSFDAESGHVEVEAGITLAALSSFLMRRGRYLAVMPGHGQITVGGSIAADVHGKNPAKDGSFSSQVLAVRLFHPVHGLNEISRQRENDILETTCGGYGLTGIILSARLATRLLGGNSFLVRALPVRDPMHGAVMMRESADTHDLIYSWHDFMSSKLGRGIVFAGSFSGAEHANGNDVGAWSLSADWRARLPFRLHGRIVGRLQNRLFYALNSYSQIGRLVSLRQGLFPVEGKEAYFLAFGASGFHEHQAIVPDAAFSTYITEVRRLAAKQGGVPIVLASGKAFGGTSSLLRFGGAGTCFALNLPRGRQTGRLLDALNDLVRDVKGKPNIIKDSTLRRRTVEACYPEYGKFRELLRRWDPKRLFQSELSRRLEL